MVHDGMQGADLDAQRRSFVAGLPGGVRDALQLQAVEAAVVQQRARHRRACLVLCTTHRSQVEQKWTAHTKGVASAKLLFEQV